MNWNDINPFLNTTIYDVEFPDGEIREYCANVIAENMYSQVDAEGYRYQLLDTIFIINKMVMPSTPTIFTLIQRVFRNE